MFPQFWLLATLALVALGAPLSLELVTLSAASSDSMSNVGTLNGPKKMGLSRAKKLDSLLKGGYTMVGSKTTLDTHGSPSVNPYSAHGTAVNHKLGINRASQPGWHPKTGVSQVGNATAPAVLDGQGSSSLGGYSAHGTGVSYGEPSANSGASTGLQDDFKHGEDGDGNKGSKLREQAESPGGGSTISGKSNTGSDALTNGTTAGGEGITSTTVGSEGTAGNLGITTSTSKTHKRFIR